MEENSNVQRNPKAIILIGAPYSGVGTRAKILSEKAAYPYICIKDLVSQAAKANSIIKERIQDGILMDDIMMYRLLIERLTQDDCNSGFILDGFPRNLKQAIQLRDIFIDLEIEIKSVIELILPYELIKERACKNKLIDQDNDDIEFILIEKLKYYNIQSTLLAEYYKNQGVHITLDSSNSPEKILEVI